MTSVEQWHKLLKALPLHGSLKITCDHFGTETCLVSGMLAQTHHNCTHILSCSSVSSSSVLSPVLCSYPCQAKERERERERVCFRMCVRMSVMHLLGPFLSHAVLLVLLDWSSTATGARLQYSFGKKSNRSRQFHTSFHRPSVNADRIRAGVHRAFVVMQSVGLHRGALHAVRGACKLCNTRGKDQS